jgi:hypothetical protein
MAKDKKRDKSGKGRKAYNPLLERKDLADDVTISSLLIKPVYWLYSLMNEEYDVYKYQFCVEFFYCSHKYYNMAKHKITDKQVHYLIKSAILDFSADFVQSAKSNTDGQPMPMIEAKLKNFVGAIHACMTYLTVGEIVRANNDGSFKLAEDLISLKK